MYKLLLVAGVGMVLATAAACGGGTSSVDKTKTAEAGKPTAAATVRPAEATPGSATKVSTPTGPLIKVTAKDFSFGLDKNSAPAGEITFSVTSSGPTDHEFVIFKTDLAPDKLPLVQDKSKVDEKGAGVEHIEEIEDLHAGDTKSLTVKLEPGKYVFVCNLPAHYGQGMYVAFTAQ